MAGMWKTLSTSFKDAIMIISMNRPKVNAMSIELLNDLDQAFDHASKNEKVRGVHLRSNLNSTFSAGLDLSDMYQRCSSGDKQAVGKFMFEILPHCITAPLRCTKPVACAIDGHAIAGGLIIALACDYIAMGTRKSFRLGVTELLVGVPFPNVPLEIIRHQLEPQLAQRLMFDANLVASEDLPLRCERGENPDELAQKWLTMVSQRPLKGFELTKKKWWGDRISANTVENEQQRQEFLDVIMRDDCTNAMKETLKK